MRIVICCDQNAPAEMVRDAVKVGGALMERGHAIVFIAGDPAMLVESAGSWTPNDLYEAPARRALPHLVMKPPVWESFVDLMALAGFDDKPTLMVLASLWNRQLLALNPDVILGFYTPVLWLVAPAHAPTFALGNGLTLPPKLDSSFPRLNANSVPLADEHLMVTNANAVLLRNGQSEWTVLSDVLDRCVSILYGVPAFDPYIRFRTTPSAGLLGEQPIPTVPPPKDRLAVFLDAYCPNVEQIVLAIGSLDDIPVDVCISGATTGMRRYLEQQPHVKVWNDYASLLAQAASATAVVHHGVQDVAQRCISLGRPQVLIPWTREQDIFNAAINWMGLTSTIYSTAPIEEMAVRLREILLDQSLAVSAQHHARELASTHLPDALPHIIEQIETSARG